MLVKAMEQPASNYLPTAQAVAIAGDVIEVRGRQVWINGKSLATAPGDTEYFDGRRALGLSFGGGRDIDPRRGEDQPGYAPRMNVTTRRFAVAGKGLCNGPTAPTSCIWEYRAYHATRPAARRDQSCKLQ